MPYAHHRLIDEPIIAPGLDARIGENIQGPSLIRAPDWLPGRLARYYLYFADHKGDQIRLAFADALSGPWTVHGPGALELEKSGFPTERLLPPPGAEPRPARGAMPDRAPPGTPGIPTLLEDASLPHIASPDAHVEEAGRRIVLYYHGLSAFGVQASRVAVSSDGLCFTPVGGEIGPAYLRVFDHAGAKHAIAMPGVMMRSPDGFRPFEAGPRLFPTSQRHSAVRKTGESLEVFCTRVGDAPERIRLSRIELGGDWRDWRASEPVEILRPERPWEGADLPLARSWRSAITAPANQLRDPAIFEEDRRVFLLYAIKGEGGIGIAELREGAARLKCGH